MQATAIAFVALVVGVPLGIVTARIVWGAIAGSMGLGTDISLPVVTLLTGALAIIVALNLISVLPALAAGRLRVAEALRAE